MDELRVNAEGTPPLTTPADVTFDGHGIPVAIVGATDTATAPPAASSPPATATAPPATAPPAPVGLTAADVAALIAAALPPAPAPPAVTRVQVNAEAFDYLRPDAPHSFVRDAFDARFARDSDAAGRLVRFSAMVEGGALRPGGVRPLANADVSERMIDAATGTTTSLPSIIPPGYRPDLYVGEIVFPRPIVDNCAAAPITDATPFTVPRFVSATGLTQDVAAEGTNPAGGTLVTDLVTITPRAVSGIFDASRELVDSSAGGVAIDMIAVAAMRESWSEQTENRAASEMNAAGNGTDVSDGAAPSGAAIEMGIRHELVALANRRKAPATFAAADALAFGALVGDNTADGRPILPYAAYGTYNVAGRQETMLGAAIIGTPVELAWALLTHVNLWRRSDVYNFESPVQQWRWDEVIGPAAIRFALFGYQAARVLRPLGVTRITYTGTPAADPGSYNPTRTNENGTAIDLYGNEAEPSKRTAKS